MNQWWRSLRVQLATLGFLAIYLPVVVLLGVVVATEDETTQTVNGVEVVAVNATERSPWTTWSVIAFGPVAAALAWWLAGKATRPIDEVRDATRNIEATDLGRRIRMTHGPTEIVQLAACFDTMLDRLQHAADTQQHLIEQTSHQLRTPLAILATNADVMLDHPDPTIDTYRHALERSRAATTRMQSTLDELLLDARGSIRAATRQLTDLVALARLAIDDARDLADLKGIDLSLTAPTAARCALDEATVRRALSNLIDNAIHYSAPGTKVDIDIQLTDLEARVTVTDDGPGISADDVDHIFERHWRGQNNTPGAGLGLPIAKQIAEAHGGSLSIAPPGPTGRGCSFQLTLRR